VPAADTTVSIGANESTTLLGLQEGTRDVYLSDVASNCLVKGDNPRSVSITAGAPTLTIFPVMCPSFSNSPVAFFSECDGGAVREIYRVNTDGSSLTRLTDAQETSQLPVRCPDGSQIAFASDRDGNTKIYVMGSDGSNPTRLTTHSKFDNWPARALDRTQIAFESDQGNFDFNRDILVMDADGSNLTCLAEDSEGDWRTEWWPSGMSTGQ
jgi:Tol biopolymer transport system component